jgi:hypothetical protein
MTDDVRERDVLKFKQVEKERAIDRDEKYVTRYSFRVAERADNSPVFLVQERQDSTAAPDRSLTDSIVRMQKFDYELEPKDIVWFEMSKEGKLERVEFGFYSADYQREHQTQQRWGEVNRRPASEREMSVELSLNLVDQFTQQQEQERPKEQEQQKQPDQQVDLSQAHIKKNGLDIDA